MPSKIPWTDETWPIVTGCSRVSAGCANCYAQREAAGRLKNHPRYKGLTEGGKWTGEVRFNAETLSEPLHWKKPRRVFVASMGDLFHDKVDPEWIDAVWKIMGLCPQHTFQVLTKRPGNMKRWLKTTSAFAEGHFTPNVWLGVTVENNNHRHRINDLLQCRAAVRFVSVEPTLGPVEIQPYLFSDYDQAAMDVQLLTPPGGFTHAKLDWVIIGAESGRRGRRPCKLEWVRSLVEQCQKADVACFVKQIDIDGKLSKDPAEWPADLRVQEYPKPLEENKRD